MLYWTVPFIGALSAGGFALIQLRDRLSLGSEHLLHASGTITAYVLIGAMLGFLLALLLDPGRQPPRKPVVQLKVLEGGKEQEPSQEHHGAGAGRRKRLQARRSSVSAVHPTNTTAGNP
jgi:hypothetical protein